MAAASRRARQADWEADAIVAHANTDRSRSEADRDHAAVCL
jgi:hypothetical protein